MEKNWNKIKNTNGNCKINTLQKNVYFLNIQNLLQINDKKIIINRKTSQKIWMAAKKMKRSSTSLITGEGQNQTMKQYVHYQSGKEQNVW